MNYDAIVVAGGVGKRANLGFNKVFYKMSNNKTVLENAYSVFLNDEDCNKIVVVTNEPERIEKNDKIITVEGGAIRAKSVYNGLIKCESEYVLIHDGARPYLTKEDVDKLKDVLLTVDGAILAKKATDTVKLINDEMNITDTLNRNNIYLAMTPQGFKTSVIKEAYNTIDVSDCTDDASVLEKFNHQVRIVEGSPNNIKLTLQEDFKEI